MKKNGGSWNIYYICRDYLGNNTHTVNADGSLKQELSYDPWGRLQNPDTQVAYTPDSEPALGRLDWKLANADRCLNQFFQLICGYKPHWFWAQDTPR